MELRALKERIESGESGDLAAIDWWGWYGNNFQRSRSDAEKLLPIAGASDPPAALDRQQQQTRARVAAHADRQRSSLRVVPSEPQRVALANATQPQPEPQRLTPTKHIEG